MNNWDSVPNHNDFIMWRKNWLEEVVSDKNRMNQIHSNVLGLDNLKYPYLWDWCGVPIIRHPSDVVLVQEFIFRFRPTLCIEVGVARGGGAVLYSSLMKLMGLTPHVLGVDIKIHRHTYEMINASGAKGIRLIEAPSTSDIAREEMIKELDGHVSVFVTLDSNHQHENVLKELYLFDEILPIGSVILVCDTIADDLVQEANAKTRNGQRGDSPKTALDSFLIKSTRWRKLKEFNQKSHFGESPSGWIVRVSN